MKIVTNLGCANNSVLRMVGIGLWLIALLGVPGAATFIYMAQEKRAHSAELYSQLNTLRARQWGVTAEGEPPSPAAIASLTKQVALIKRLPEPGSKILMEALRHLEELLPPQVRLYELRYRREDQTLLLRAESTDEFPLVEFQRRLQAHACCADVVLKKRGSRQTGSLGINRRVIHADLQLSWHST